MMVPRETVDKLCTENIIKSLFWRGNKREQDRKAWK